MRLRVVRLIPLASTSPIVLFCYCWHFLEGEWTCLFIFPWHPTGPWDTTNLAGIGHFTIVDSTIVEVLRTENPKGLLDISGLQTHSLFQAADFGHNFFLEARSGKANGCFLWVTFCRLEDGWCVGRWFRKAPIRGTRSAALDPMVEVDMMGFWWFWWALWRWIGVSSILWALLKGCLPMAAGDELWCARAATSAKAEVTGAWASQPRSHLDLDPAKAVEKGKDFFRPTESLHFLHLLEKLYVAEPPQAVLSRHRLPDDSDSGNSVGQDMRGYEEQIWQFASSIHECWVIPGMSRCGVLQELVIPLVLVTSLGFVGPDDHDYAAYALSLSQSSLSSQVKYASMHRSTACVKQSQIQSTPSQFATCWLCKQTSRYK